MLGKLSHFSALATLLITTSANAATPLHSAEENSFFSASALGAAGPMGAFGPLSTLGPIGTNRWNPSSYLASSGDWSGFAKMLSANGGPLSAAGPLGPNGILGAGNYASVPKEFKADGAFGVLGPAGPFGPLGPLGPLGPVGAHGNNPTARTADVAGVGRFFLVELYAGERARQLADYDTSFIAMGDVDSGQVDTYDITSPDDQVVSVLVVPEKSLDAFGVSVTSEDSRTPMRSESSSVINWLTFRASSRERLQVKVRLLGSAQWLSHSYRLIVVGAGPAR